MLQPLKKRFSINARRKEAEPNAMDPDTAKALLGENFIGPEELGSIRKALGLPGFSRIPRIPYPVELLKHRRKDSILILGATHDRRGRPLTLNSMKKAFGSDPSQSEPCFYPQDWYQRERFANEVTPGAKWYLIRRRVEATSRGRDPLVLDRALPPNEAFPPAVLTAFVFFAYFLNTGVALWDHDFIWCADKDANGDRIYTGRYRDPKGLCKNGFSVHRHLSIRNCYGLAALSR
jgi:hypothetical protein